MSKSYREWTAMQSYLLPPSPTEWLPQGHLAYFLLDVAETIDIGEIERAVQAKDWRGERPYPPRLMVALLLYGYAIGIVSSRRIARATYEDVAFRVIAGDAHPSFTTINQFRLDHLGAFRKLFVEVLRLCQRAGLVSLGHVAIDGSKIKANASKRKAMSYERMQQSEARLEQEVDAILDQAAAADAAEDAQYGAGEMPADLPAELHRREDRLARIRQAKAELEQEAAQARAEELRKLAEVQRDKAADPTVPTRERAAAATRADNHEADADELDDNDGPPPSSDADMPHHRVPTTPEGTPTPKAQRNFTDADSRIMVHDGGFVQAYNAQIVVDDAHQIIVAEAVTNQPPDAEHLVPMIHRAVVNCDDVPDTVTADAGYFSDGNVRAAERYGCDPYIPVDRQRRSSDGGGRQLPPTPMREHMRRKLETPTGKAIYARRKCTVEPVFGQIKGARGFRRFSLRTRVKAAAEWTLVCLTHNLLKLFRAAGRQQLAAVAA
ncbi:MAG TPA: IS1182 family transposase [Kofleriaceae bacterium]|nr:IS1182 family transposase [Kofleriaceae bacterium]